VLLAGTGLTATDIVVTLIERGHRGPIVAVSRHGLLPATHAVDPAPALPPCIQPADGQTTTTRQVLQSLRRAIADAHDRGDDWRRVVDGLRPVTVALWRTLPLPERARFLRHCARRWEVARHRIPPQVGMVVADALRRGQLRIHSGRITGFVGGPNGIDVAISSGGTTVHIAATVAVDCTGPTADPATGGVVLRDLLERGLARRDVNGLGLVTAEDGAVIDHTGRPSGVLFAMGVLRRGAEWESTAVPELRAQAEALATLLTHGRRRVAA
jgi:uncharacterized NAD(P)/FAD-binding protein YdhS